MKRGDIEPDGPPPEKSKLRALSGFAEQSLSGIADSNKNIGAARQRATQDGVFDVAKFLNDPRYGKPL